MIGNWIDGLIGAFSPQAGLQRIRARSVMRKLQRGYAGAESNRLTASKKPKNQAADSELAAPWGADSARAWARQLVRDDPYAWGVVDTIVSSVVGRGIEALSVLETPEGEDLEDINDARDSEWNRWCQVADINGQLTFAEIQAICQREIVEAGEVLVHMVNVPRKHNGILRNIPLALELIEADRLSSDRDTFARTRAGENRVVRGVEMDDLGRPIAYWVYPQHPTAPQTISQTPIRLPASNVLHLFRKDRVGQSRGISWFAPAITMLRDLGLYRENEMQASAVASCFSVFIKTNSTYGGIAPSTDEDTTDAEGNDYEFMQSGIVSRLQPNESIEVANPARPNSSADPWINMMLRSVAVGTGLSYETVARDYSRTTFSSNRASQLEDRRRFRRWQDYLINHLCKPVRDRFHKAAAAIGHGSFPTSDELLTNPEAVAPVEYMPPGWEWVDPQAEQTASAAAIIANQSTYQEELGIKGRNWRNVFYQRRKEKRLERRLGIEPEITPTGQPIVEPPKSEPKPELEPVI